MGMSLIDWLIYAQEEMLGVLWDIQLVQRFSGLGLSGRAKAMVLHLAHEVDPKGDIVRPEDEEEEFGVRPSSRLSLVRTCNSHCAIVCELYSIVVVLEFIVKGG